MIKSKAASLQVYGLRFTVYGSHPNGRPVTNIYVKNVDFPKRGSIWITLLALLFGSLLPFSSSFADGWADSWEDMRKAFSVVKSIETDFVQKKNMKILSRPLISKGRFFFRAPTDIRWEYTAPIRSVLLMERGDVKRYTWRGSSYVQDKGIGLEAMGVILLDISKWLAGDFESSQHFKASLKHDPLNQVILIPRNKSATEFIQKVILTLSDRPGILKSVEIVETPDNKTLIEFQNSKINISFPKRLFRKAQWGRGSG